MGELPDRCLDCPHFDLGWSECKKNGYELYEEEVKKWRRPSWCPLEVENEKDYDIYCWCDL